MAKINFKEGKFEEAIMTIYMVLQDQEENFEAFFYKGSILLAQNKLKEALKAFNQSTLINPEFIDTFLSKAKTYLKKN